MNVTRQSPTAPLQHLIKSAIGPFPSVISTNTGKPDAPVDGRRSPEGYPSGYAFTFLSPLPNGYKGTGSLRPKGGVRTDELPSASEGHDPSKVVAYNGSSTSVPEVLSRWTAATKVVHPYFKTMVLR